jgi:hypothetical protein
MDLAEAYASAEPTEPGDLVSLVPNAEAKVRKSTHRYEPLLMGVVSTNPGLVFDEGKTHLAGDNSRLATREKTVIALTGRVPVKVSIENGSIHVGDPLTSSSRPGRAMKATAAGKIIGYALAAAEKDGTVLALVQPGYLASALAPKVRQIAVLQRKLHDVEHENRTLSRENLQLGRRFERLNSRVDVLETQMKRASATARMLPAETVNDVRSEK